jgi:hypothetical protein
VFEFQRRRLLERDDRGALRVQCSKHVVDGPVFAARVDSLQDDQQRVFFSAYIRLC